MEYYHENVIEFLKGQDTATVSLYKGGKFYNRVKRYAGTYPDECKIIAENKDGSIMAHVPVSWVRISPPRTKNMSEEERAKLADRMRKVKKE